MTSQCEGLQHKIELCSGGHFREPTKWTSGWLRIVIGHTIQDIAPCESLIIAIKYSTKAFQRIVQ